MSDETNEVTIEIRGDSGSGKTLIANVVADALEKAGFTDISMLDQSSNPTDRLDTITVLDLVKQARPNLFNTAIVISEHDTTEDERDLYLVDQHNRLEEAIELAEAA